MMADKPLTDPKAWLAARHAQASASASQVSAQPEVQYGKIDETPIAQQNTAQPGLWDRIKRFALDPAMDTFGGGANMTARALMTQATGDPMLYDTIRMSQKQGPTVADSQHPFMYGVRQAVGGMAADTADTAAGFTSPVSLGTMGLGVVGKGTGAAAKLAQMGTKAIGTGFALKGVGDVTDAATNPDLTPAERAQEGLGGGAMMAGGYAGASEQPKYGELAKQLSDRAPQNLNMALSRTFLSGDPVDLLTRAVKPSVAKPEFESALKDQFPTLFQLAQERGTPTGVKQFGTLTDTAADVKDSQFQDLMAPYRPPTAALSNGQAVRAAGPYNPVAVDGSPIADAQVRSIPFTDRLENPSTRTPVQRGARQLFQGNQGIVADTEDIANNYRQPLELGELDTIRTENNAKLLDRLYNKTPEAQTAAIKSNPEIARLKATGDTARDLQYSKLFDLTGEDPQPIQNAYGDLKEIGNVANKRGIVFGRQNPASIAQDIAVNTGGGNIFGKVLDYAGGKLFKGATDSDAAVRLAFDRFGRSQQPKVGGKFGYGSFAAALAAARQK